MSSSVVPAPWPQMFVARLHLCGNQPVRRVRPCWLRRAVRNKHRHAIEQASRRWRGGRRDDSARTRRKILISTQGCTRNNTRSTRPRAPRRARRPRRGRRARPRRRRRGGWIGAWCDSAVFNEREASSEGLAVRAGSGAGVGARRGRGAATARGAAAARRTGKVPPLQPGGRRAGSRRYFRLQSLCSSIALWGKK